MKIKIDVENTFPQKRDLMGDFDLFINGFNGCDRVKYSKELSGQTTTLKDICRLSDITEKTVISAFDTDNYGIIKHSVGVFDRGKLIGISDMSVNLDGGAYMPGIGGKLYETKSGKIGIAVGDDLFSFGLFKSLAVCGAEIIIAVSAFSKKEINSVILRAYSYLLGVPAVLIFSGGAYVSGVDGNLISPSNENLEFEVFPLVDFILKTTKIKLKK